MKRDKCFVAVGFAAALLLCFATVCGCASPAPQGEPANSPAVNVGETEIEQLPTQAEYELPDPVGRGRVRVQEPEGYECSEYLEDIEPYTGKALELESLAVDLGERGSLRITVDDVGFFDWWYGGSAYGAASASGYIESAMGDPANSGWHANIGGRDGAVLITGAADRGGEQSGDAFVFLDGATVAFSAVLPGGSTPAADAYSAFFRSQEVTDLLGGLSISVE